MVLAFASVLAWVYLQGTAILGLWERGVLVPKPSTGAKGTLGHSCDSKHLSVSLSGYCVVMWSQWTGKLG